jgi:GNAT superfamily N-acetyltransferase
MKTGKRTHGAASCTLRYSMLIDPANRGKVRELVGMRVEAGHRGKGQASALLKQVCEEADAAGVALLVTVKPFGKSKMDKKALAVWYARNGFEPIQYDPLVMVRA